MKPTIVVHGGAGAWKLDSERLQGAIDACIKAARAGQAILLSDGSALDAAEAAVRILEDCPLLDAGRGSYPNSAGEIEMDALIMDGRQLALGAVGAVERVRNPISLARRVMTDTKHSFLVAAGAEDFADQIAFPRCETSELRTDAEVVPQSSTGAESASAQSSSAQSSSAQHHDGPLGDTVGAVALDRHGNLATAVSTGGTAHKRPGRIGDSPLVGSGGYADNWTAAAAATGHGEALMKIVISKMVCDLVGQGLSAQNACTAAIRRLEERVQGEGGLIAVDARGNIGIAFNTVAMPHAYAVGEGDIVGNR